MKSLTVVVVKIEFKALKKRVFQKSEDMQALTIFLKAHHNFELIKNLFLKNVVFAWFFT